MEADGESGVMKQMRLRWEARAQAASEFLQEYPLVGLSVDEAERLAREAGVAFRCVLDGQPMSADMQPGRITAMEKAGVVVSARVGN